MPLILIVDDSPTEVHVMQKALEKHGYRTAAAADGAEGVRLAREMSPDLIFMDIVMPGMNGYQATRALANDPPIVLADEPTGNLDSATSGEILELLRRSVDEYGQTIVMVTHEARAAATAHRVLFLADGEIVRELGECDSHEILTVMEEVAAA